MSIGRYLVFTGSYYYPKGGAKDYFCNEDNLEGAKGELMQQLNDEDNTHGWGHIYDTETREIVYDTDKK